MKTPKDYKSQLKNLRRVGLVSGRQNIKDPKVKRNITRLVNKYSIRTDTIRVKLSDKKSVQEFKSKGVRVSKDAAYINAQGYKNATYNKKTGTIKLRSKDNARGRLYTIRDKSPDRVQALLNSLGVDSQLKISRGGDALWKTSMDLPGEARDYVQAQAWVEKALAADPNYFDKIIEVIEYDTGRQPTHPTKTTRPRKTKGARRT